MDYVLFIRVPTMVVEMCFTLLITMKFLYDKLCAKDPISHTLFVFIRDGAWAFCLVFGQVTSNSNLCLYGYLSRCSRPSMGSGTILDQLECLTGSSWISVRFDYCSGDNKWIKATHFPRWLFAFLSISVSIFCTYYMMFRHWTRSPGNSPYSQSPLRDKKRYVQWLQCIKHNIFCPV
jgi:hypothetical protein